jgi:bifunctional polynucleotide phosphatase/kinase
LQRERCVKVAEEALRSKQSVVIDNTNPDRDVRGIWTSLAKKHAVPVRCVHFTAEKELARHNDVVRALSGLGEVYNLEIDAKRLCGQNNPESREMLPLMAFNFYASRFQEPHLDEGFVDIIKVDFSFSGSEQARLAWSRYWT